MAAGRGENDFGIANGQFRSKELRSICTHGYYCDTSVASAQHDPLFITVPMGFSPGRMTECPANKPLYPSTATPS